jgi:5'-nucleotidase
MLRVLLTNDDGIDAEGLQTLRHALLDVPGVDLRVVAPDSNRSAVGRGITMRRALAVERVDFPDGTVGYATDGTPVDCVRLAHHGLLGDWRPDLVVSGINHGCNLGDDVTYSGTVAAAMEALMLDLPGIAVSQQSKSGRVDFQHGEAFTFDHAARFVARVVAELDDVPLPPSTLLNINLPHGEPEGVEVTRLGKRVYRDKLAPTDDDAGPDAARRTYFLYGPEPGFEHEPGTDLVAVAEGRIAVTPIHMDLTHHDGIGTLSGADLARLLAPAAREVE